MGRQMNHDSLTITAYSVNSLPLDNWEVVYESKEGPKILQQWATPPKPYQVGTTLIKIAPQDHRPGRWWWAAR